MGPYSPQIAAFSHFYNFIFSMTIREKEQDQFSFLRYPPFFSSWPWLPIRILWGALARNRWWACTPPFKTDLIGLGWGPGSCNFEKFPRWFQCAVRVGASGLSTVELCYVLVLWKRFTGAGRNLLFPTQHWWHCDGQTRCGIPRWIYPDPCLPEMVICYYHFLLPEVITWVILTWVSSNMGVCY